MEMHNHHHVNRVSRVLWNFLPLAVIACGVCLLVSATVQQNYRQSLNDPQIQMAEDAVAQLAKDYTPAAVVPRPQTGAAPVDIAASLAPWIAVYDASGTPLESSAELNGAPPRLPAGVFDTSVWNAPIIGHHVNSAPANENRFTWQPEPGVREAVVLVAFQTPDGIGYVAAGRNMREVEAREDALAKITALALAAILAAVLALLTIRDFVLFRE